MRIVATSLAVSANAFLLLLAPNASAQTAPDVTSEKRASAQDVITNAYTRVEVRHGLNLNMNGESVGSMSPRMEVRPTVGTRLANGRLDLNVTFGAIKDSKTAEFKQRNPEIIAELSAFSSNNFSLTPFLDVFTPFAGKGTTGKMALNTEVKSREFSGPAGSLTLTASVEPGIETASRSGFAPVENQVGRPGNDFGLVFDEKTQTEQTTKREPNMSNETVAAITFKPARISGLTASLSGFVDTEWMPKYEAVASAQSESGVDVRKVGYSVSNTSFNRVRLTWAVNDRVLFINDTLQYIDGIYEKRVDGKRWENVARLSYTLL